MEPAAQSVEEGKKIFGKVAKEVVPCLETVMASLLQSEYREAQFLNEPVVELFRRGGKRIRPVLAAMIARCFGWP